MRLCKRWNVENRIRLYPGSGSRNMMFLRDDKSHSHGGNGPYSVCTTLRPVYRVCHCLHSRFMNIFCPMDYVQGFLSSRFHWRSITNVTDLMLNHQHKQWRTT
ncbi:hypothetical protein TNCV_4957171 [Trichonephila clavipes]|nr:hypothetical protein TNCV_4957171 [Trichonephila clavipes]